MRKAIFVLLGLCCWSLAASAQGVLPIKEPRLRVETGMHPSQINALAVDANCRFLATGSDDKTVRIWARTGKQFRLHRRFLAPFAKNTEGKIDGTALSPDAKYVAFGVSDDLGGHAVYVGDVSTERFVRRLLTGKTVVHNLAFSPDGRHLAAILSEGGGLRVWETATWQMVIEDADYRSAFSFGVTFIGDNVYTTAQAGDATTTGAIRRYVLDGKATASTPVAQEDTVSGTKPYSVVSDPSGQSIIVAFDAEKSTETKDQKDMRRRLDRYDAQTLKFIEEIVYDDVTSGDLSFANFSKDGKKLFAGGTWKDNKAGHAADDEALHFIISDADGRNKFRSAAVGDTWIQGILPCKNDMAFVTADPSFGIMSMSGEIVAFQRAVTSHFRYASEHPLLLSPDGRRVEFAVGTEHPERVQFDIDRPINEELITDGLVSSGLRKPNRNGLKLTEFKDSEEPKLDGEVIPLEHGDHAHSAAITHDNKHFVIGTEIRLMYFTASGVRLWMNTTPSTVRDLNISADGALIVAAYADGTVRWHRTKDGQEMLALFVHPERKSWIAWTPNAHYIASVGGEKYVGFQVNGTWEQAPVFHPLSGFRERFWSPEIVKRTLLLPNEDLSGAAAQKPSVDPTLPQRDRLVLPPLLRIIQPATGDTFSEPTLTFVLDIRNEKREPVTDADVEIRVNNELQAISKSLIPVAKPNDGYLRRIVTMPPRDASISIVARDRKQPGAPASEPQVVQMRWTGTAVVPQVPLPKVRALLVGVDYANHSNPELRLKFASKDASNIETWLNSQKGRMFSDVQVRNPPSGSFKEIIDGLSWLHSGSGPNTLTILFLSGHGVVKNDLFYFLPNNFNSESLESTAISRDQILNAIKLRKGDMLLLLDTCHAGASVVDGLGGGVSAVNTTLLTNQVDVEANKLTVLASAKGSQKSFEREDWGRGGNGAFTAAFLEGVNGAAMKDDSVEIERLHIYIKDRVRELTGKLQEPTMALPAGETITFRTRLAQAPPR